MYINSYINENKILISFEIAATCLRDKEDEEQKEKNEERKKKRKRVEEIEKDRRRGQENEK
ncbi:hypothetical protein SK128_021400 [Halocaridina rubra]|uniref:Uncharacterized protein n=1 Tax=Halocaridina rubra TaxID=373956 RepID=A0AAN8WZR1_HALRR